MLNPHCLLCLVFIIFKAFLFNFLYRRTLHLDSIQICNDNLFRKMYCCLAFCYHCFKEILSPHINSNCFASHANCALWIQRQFITGFSRDLGKICWRGGGIFGDIRGLYNATATCQITRAANQQRSWLIFISIIALPCTSLSHCSCSILFKLDFSKLLHILF